MKLEFDLEHPGDFSLELPAKASPFHEKFMQKLHLNKAGELIRKEKEQN